MDDFGGWSVQYAAEPDGLLGEFLDGGFDLRSDHGGGLDLPSSCPAQNLMQCHDGGSLSDGVPEGFMGLDTADVLPGVAGAAGDSLLDPFVYVVPDDVAVVEEPAQTPASNTAFSGYSGSTTGGGGNGNISSGESNTCGGGGGYDTDVASPCAVSRTALLQTTTGGVPPSKRKLAGKCPAIAASSGAKAAAGRRGEKRATAATSSLSSTSITFAAGQGHDEHAAGGSGAGGGSYEPDSEAIAQVKEMIYRAAAMRPVHQLVCGAAEPASQQARPRRRNVRISSDPQTVAARLRRERVSERLRVLQKLVPGGSKMDTASMLDEAASYLKFLKSQVQALETLGTTTTSSSSSTSISAPSMSQHYSYFGSGSSSGNPGFLGLARRSSNISPAGYVNPNGSTNTSSKLL